MKRRAVIGLMVAVSALAVGLKAYSDDYVEDVYYWSDSRTQQTEGTVVPTYNPRAREIIFIEDSLSLQHPDTVRAILREAPL